MENIYGPAAERWKQYAYESFLYALVVISVYVWARSLVCVVYAVIDFTLATPGSYTYLTVDSAAGGCARIIVAFPVFVCAHAALRNVYANRPESTQWWARYWLVYAALVYVMILTLNDVAHFLGDSFQWGQYLQNYVKSLAVLAIGGGVFAYYLSTVLGPALAPRRDRIADITAFSMVAAGLGLGFSTLNVLHAHT
jgi:hypothetical protein